MRCLVFAACLTWTTLFTAVGGSAPERGGPPPTVTVAALRTEYLQNPIGIDAAKPRLSWQIRSAVRGVSQSA